MIFVSLLLCICSTLQAKERVIDRPPFLVSSTTIVEVSKVVLNDTATVLHMYAKYHPKNWIKIPPETCLKGNDGKKYTLRSGIGIKPDEAFFMPESGEAEFQLVFPPLDKKVTSFDFIVSEEINVLNLWGIQLKGKLPKLELPEDLKSVEPMIVDALPEPVLKNGKAIIEGKLMDYRPGMEKKVIIQTSEPVRGTWSVEAEVQPDGSFTASVPLLSATSAYIIAGGQPLQIVLEPDKTVRAYINQRELSRRASKYHSDAEPYGKMLYTDSPWESVSRGREEALRTVGSLINSPSAYSAEMTLAEFKETVLSRMNEALETVGKLDISLAARQAIVYDIKYFAFSQLNFAANYLARLRSESIREKTGKGDFQKIYKELLAQIPNDYVDAGFVREMDGLRFLPFLSNNILVNLYVTCNRQGLELRQLAPLIGAYLLQQDISNLTPLTDEQKASLKDLPQAYADFLTASNDELLAKIEANKKKTGFTVNETGEVANEDLFASIISKYRGKVILVDFWATWCGPCRMANKEMAPMKEELKDKDIVYLYIAGENSPIGTWKSMIPDIHGEHFRVTAAQWKYLGDEFKVEGVPTYLIVDKEGGISYKCVGFPGVGKMKEELQKALSSDKR